MTPVIPANCPGFNVSHVCHFEVVQISRPLHALELLFDALLVLIGLLTIIAIVLFSSEEEAALGLLVLFFDQVGVLAFWGNLTLNV